MLEKARIGAFVATAQPERAKTFYEKVLGLRLVSEDRFALSFDSQGVSLRVQKVEKLTPQPFTALGWMVRDIRAMIAGLAKAGVQFERYSFLEQDEAGVWTAPGGTKVAWFKDPDGNLLSLAEHAG